MHSKNILITGATGFVGCRLAERLVLGTDYNVTAMIHRFSGPGLARLARLPVKLTQADLLEPKSLDLAAKNCEILIHLAYGTSGDESTRREITVAGTENIFKAALKNKVRKIIHFSTAAVHGIHPKSPILDESAPFEVTDDPYGRSKIEAEKVVWRHHQEDGVPVVVFRPPLIYGPNGRFWTVRIIEEILNGAILVNGGTGRANMIYIDNLIDAVLLAIEKDSGDGEAFFAVDDDFLTWKQVYEAYASMVHSHPPFRTMSEEEIETMRKGDAPNDLKSWIITPLLLVPAMVRTSLQSAELRKKMMQVPWLRFLKDRISRQRLDELKYGENTQETAIIQEEQSDGISLPKDNLVKLYSSQSRFSNEKIKKVLAYSQRITFEEAIDLTGSWLRYQRLIPSSPPT